MCSKSSSNKQWDSTWASLPAEIRLLIYEALAQDGCPLSHLATVSREWQIELEPYNFARIKLTPSRTVDFGSMIHRNRALVGYIWFCLELDNYDCSTCAPFYLTTDERIKALIITDTDHCPITASFETLFSVLSTWEHGRRDLTLDISIHSPSDSEHWFKYLTFLPDYSPSDRRRCRAGGIEQTTTAKQVHHDPQHGWVAGFRHSAPPPRAFYKIFHDIMDEGPFESQEVELEWWNQLPSVPAVTSLLLRQQNRRRWKPQSLACMIARFPRLQQLHYEPWREWGAVQMYTDLDLRVLFDSLRKRNTNLKRLVVFENFNQQYPVTLQVSHGWPFDWMQCDAHRRPSRSVSRMMAFASLELEHLAASFLVDAAHFFDAEPSWAWPNLTSLVLTSELLVPDEEEATYIGVLLRAAAKAAMKMPRLATMEIWNGRKGLAALFKYQAFRRMQKAVISWRGTWKLTMEPSVLRAWEAVVHQQDGWRLDVAEEWLDEAAIVSHGDAIQCLMLSGEVIRPVSLQQIQMEQRALEGAGTV
ncbi:hypothetical protein VFPPC_15228 [Pochonia chlamydosporia 170]|uniref:DUF6546 domain-containing protein n=1 Tax=Pochonia chlamydosporia 170 TaxID=1380566 RepID=A0A179G541_METCM|nr:hypothetical protein VFPPC_15228 [Pochonia chlamydosporia 170]OAQ72975.2 hypothetical protein VFPPC_15228 [Pochonia chlamydosporia 170]